MSSDERELALAWDRYVGDSRTARTWFDQLVAHHRHPSRHYHDLRHVRWVVHHVRRLATEIGLDPASTRQLVTAAFFHDAVYDPRRTDSEAESAALARRALHELGWHDDDLDRVAALVTATAHHRPADRATAVLIAADLGVLAAEPARYADYVRNVRREYHHLDDRTWSHGRAAFVREMLDRDAIFPTNLGLDAWERRARANLTAELAAIGSVSGGGEADAPEP